MAMKRLACRDLGGPCDTEFTADSFEEMGKKAQQHAMEQMQNGDEAHLLAANKMRNATPEQQKA
jgi:predicted small metal-binding protein